MPHHADGIEITIESRDGISKLLIAPEWVTDNVPENAAINEHFAQLLISEAKQDQRINEQAGQQKRADDYIDRLWTFVP